MIALRGYTRRHTGDKPKTGSRIYTPMNHERVLVFDTETTVDHYQNLKIGYFKLYQSGFLQRHGLFYHPYMLDDKEIQILETYAAKERIPLCEVDEFIDDVFYKEVYENRSLCIGFNLPFDISRLAFDVGQSRKNNKGGFTLHLSLRQWNPPVIIKKIGSAHTMKFSTLVGSKLRGYFPGYFLDIQTLAEVLYKVEHLSLARLGDLLNLKNKKIDGGEHGRVTEKYIEYNIRDVVCTYEAYTRVMEELNRYEIDIPPTKIFSSASLGKHVLQQLGIRTFRECQPDFSPETLGHLMTAYYGGRTECKIRKTPTRVTGLDFTSMYPSVTMLLDLWAYIVAQSLEPQDATEETRELVSRVTLSSLLDRNIWKSLVVLVKVQPDGDILPVRADYHGDGRMFNVGINSLTSETPLWYTLPDVIASKILTGKAPRILEAIRFVPKGVQENLIPSNILGIPLDPAKDNLIQVLVEERQRIKRQLKTIPDTDPNHHQLFRRAEAMKILVNAMSYGIFLELNRESDKSTFDVYGLAQFTPDECYFENPGQYFHPLLGVVITAGSRLFLAMAEAKTLELGAHHAYMDTDSIFVPPEHAQTVADFFQPLNPYRVDIPLLKQEKIDLWFYGVSSKRYVLYKREGDAIKIEDFKLHGLGHLTNPFPSRKGKWQEEIWHDLLMLHYGQIAPIDIEQKYGNLYALSKLTISTYHVFHRFNTLNAGKDWCDQVKPFNFYNLGFQTREENGKMIKPLAPYSKEPQKIVHAPFIDYETGTLMQGSRFFKPLSRTILQYVDHPEYKYDGNVGLLSRKLINVDGVLIIGKEANKIEDQPLFVTDAQVFKDKKSICKKILSIRQCDAEKAGVDRKTFQRIKTRIQKSKTINIKTGAVKRLLAMC